MPPKRRRPSFTATLASLREVAAQLFSPTSAPTGAPKDDAAPPPLEILPATAAPIATEQSTSASTATTGRSLPNSIRCKSKGDYLHL
ncbi:hypothetical protein LguiA_004487 [Lonicera macranthoides]